MNGTPPKRSRLLNFDAQVFFNRSQPADALNWSPTAGANKSGAFKIKSVPSNDLTVADNPAFKPLVNVTDPPVNHPAALPVYAENFTLLALAVIAALIVKADLLTPQRLP